MLVGPANGEITFDRVGGMSLLVTEIPSHRLEQGFRVAGRPPYKCELCIPASSSTPPIQTSGFLRAEYKLTFSNECSLYSYSQKVLESIPIVDSVAEVRNKYLPFHLVFKVLWSPRYLIWAFD
jgi:hypothetical protein